MGRWLEELVLLESVGNSLRMVVGGYALFCSDLPLSYDTSLCCMSVET